MVLSPRARRVLPRLAETLLVGAVGGALFGLPGFPAGWLSGSMLAVSAWALARRPVLVPDALAKVVFVALGISLGAAVTPETVARMAAWPVSLAALSLAMISACGAATAYLRFVHGWQWSSALFAASPGALSQTLALAAEMGADLRSVAMVQSVRLLVLVAALPIALSAFADTGLRPGQILSVSLAASLGELAILILLSTAAAVLASRFRVPGGLIAGSMAASGTLHGTGFIDASLPPAVAISSFVILGSMIGARFAGADIRLFARLFAAGLGALAVGMSVAGLFALAVAELLSLRIGDVIIAYAPGGLEAMTILSFALGLDPAFVGAHHLGRFVLVSVALPIAVQIVVGRGGRSAGR